MNYACRNHSAQCPLVAAFTTPFQLTKRPFDNSGLDDGARSFNTTCRTTLEEDFALSFKTIS